MKWFVGELAFRPRHHRSLKFRTLLVAAGHEAAVEGAAFVAAVGKIVERSGDVGDGVFVVADLFDGEGVGVETAGEAEDETGDAAAGGAPDLARNIAGFVGQPGDGGGDLVHVKASTPGIALAGSP